MDQSPTRPLVHRTNGHRQGFLTHLLYPGNGGEFLKPFAALDFFASDYAEVRGFAPHPHSGIATHTTFLEGTAHYADSTGKAGVLHAGSVEWMRAGSGVWHGGEMGQGKPFRGYQLWISLPPELELAPAESLYLEPGRIPQDGPARVLLGRYGSISSEIELPVAITYLHVRLKGGERWTYQPAVEHELAWLAVNQGRLHYAGDTLERELAVFADGNDPIDVLAQGDAEFVIGSAKRHPHSLVCAATSIHTSQSALTEGRRRIVELGRSAAVTGMQPGGRTRETASKAT